MFKNYIFIITACCLTAYAQADTQQSPLLDSMQNINNLGSRLRQDIANLAQDAQKNPKSPYAKYVPLSNDPNYYTTAANNIALMQSYIANLEGQLNSMIEEVKQSIDNIKANKKSAKKSDNKSAQKTK